LPGNKHKDRLTKKVEDVYKTVSDVAIPDYKYYLQLELAGSLIDDDDADFNMPTLKYCFKPATK